MIILGTNSIKDTGYNVDNSLRFDDAGSDYLRTSGFGTPTSSKKMTISFWTKRANLGINTRTISATTSGNSRDGLMFNTSDKILFFLNNAPAGNLVTTRVFRDTSAWYHFVIAIDTTQGTASNRVKIYVNGVQETLFDSGGDGIVYPDENYDILGFGQNKEQTIGADNSGGGSNEMYTGYMAEFCFIDGQALAPTSFGEFDEDSGVWKPIDVSGLTFGNNGYYLDFENSGALGADVSGNTNNFAVNNLTAIDQTTDTCTNNFATLNPLSVNSDQGTFSEGNLQLLHGSNAFRTGFASIGASQGKWYCEIKRVTATSFAVGVISLDFKSITPNITYMGGVGTPNLGYFRDGNTGVNGSETSGYASYANGDTLMIGLDLDNGKVYFGKNGTWGNSGDPTSGATGTGARSITVGGEVWSFGVSVYNATAQCNFGSPPYAISSGNTDGDGFGNFEYAVPSGYFSLCTKNLAEYG